MIFVNRSCWLLSALPLDLAAWWFTQLLDTFVFGVKPMDT
jgi:hypothetical protein